MRTSLGLVATLLVTIACGGYSTTTRLVDGRTLTGSPVAPQAYSLYLDATLKEASGEFGAARDSYLAALDFEGDSADLWTRVAVQSCRLELDSADDEFERALSLDAVYAPAWIGRSRCEFSRGNPERALTFAARAQRSAADDFETTEVLASTYEAMKAPEAALRQWVGYAVLHPEDPRGCQQLVRLASGHEQVHWRYLANTCVSSEHRTNGAAPVASIRAAIVSGDLDRARSLATDHRLPQLLVLELALEFGQPGLALAQARVLVAADPTAADVRALSLLAATRAGNDDDFQRWLRLPTHSTSLTVKGEQALAAVLVERGAATLSELNATPLGARSLPPPVAPPKAQ